MVVVAECPVEFYECLTEEEWDDIVYLFEENNIEIPQAIGDVEAASDFVGKFYFFTCNCSYIAHYITETGNYVYPVR